MSYSEASPLPDALVDHQLAEEARGASRGQLWGCGSPLASHHTGHLGWLQLQVHVLLERPNARVHLHTQLVGWHPCRQTCVPLSNSANFCPTVVPLARHVWFILSSCRHSEVSHSCRKTEHAQTVTQQKASSHIPFCCLDSALLILPLFPRSSRV